MILEVAVIFLALVWALSLWFFLNYSKRQRELAAQQAAGDALRDQRIKDLAKRLDDYQNGTVRMGEALHDLRVAVAPLADKIQQLEQRDPHNVTFTQ
ncbi:chemotaxis protein, partial [Pseudomonas putida]